MRHRKFFYEINSFLFFRVINFDLINDWFFQFFLLLLQWYSVMSFSHTIWMISCKNLPWSRGWTSLFFIFIFGLLLCLNNIDKYTTSNTHLFGYIIKKRTNKFINEFFFRCTYSEILNFLTNLYTNCFWLLSTKKNSTNK